MRHFKICQVKYNVCNLSHQQTVLQEIQQHNPKNFMKQSILFFAFMLSLSFSLQAQLKGTLYGLAFLTQKDYRTLSADTNIHPCHHNSGGDKGLLSNTRVVNPSEGRNIIN